VHAHPWQASQRAHIISYGAGLFALISACLAERDRARACMSRHALACHAMQRVTDQHRLALLALAQLLPLVTPSDSSTKLGGAASKALVRRHARPSHLQQEPPWCHPLWRVAGGWELQGSASGLAAALHNKVTSAHQRCELSRSRRLWQLSETSRAPVAAQAFSATLPATRSSHEARPSRRAARGAARRQACLHAAATPGALLRASARQSGGRSPAHSSARTPHAEEQGHWPGGRACQARSRRRWHAPLWPARQAALWHAGEQ